MDEIKEVSVRARHEKSYNSTEYSKKRSALPKGEGCIKKNSRERPRKRKGLRGKKTERGATKHKFIPTNRRYYKGGGLSHSTKKKRGK